jgi:hypothetical protein
MIDKKKYEEMVADSTPGKFEGENPETAYYYDAMMNGDGEIISFGENEVYTIFEISEEEKDVFDLHVDMEKNPVDYFSIWISEQGFVYGRPMTKTMYDDLVAESEKYYEENEEL